MLQGTQHLKQRLVHLINTFTSNPFGTVAIRIHLPATVLVLRHHRGRFKGEIWLTLSPMKYK